MVSWAAQLWDYLLDISGDLKVRAGGGTEVSDRAGTLTPKGQDRVPLPLHLKDPTRLVNPPISDDLVLL